MEAAAGELLERIRSYALPKRGEGATYPTSVRSWRASALPRRLTR
jgi:hypothetical protein